MANKSNPTSLSGMQGAIMSDDSPSADMLLASQIAVQDAVSNTNLSGKNVIYKLLDTRIKGVYDFILIDDVKSRSGVGNERIRVLQGFESIWQKDQKDLDKDYIKTNKRRLIFQKGIAIVPAWDTQVHEFMDLSNANVDNPNKTVPRNTKFFKWNPAKQAQEILKQEQLELDAIFAARDAKPDAMRKHASYLGVSFVDELGEPLDESGIRAYYIRRAKSDPKRFMESIGKKDVEVTWLVKKALRDAKIDTGRAHGAIHWADGGFICKLPSSQQAANYLIELANTNSEDGRNFLKELQERIS